MTTLNTRIAALERRSTAGRLAPPALIRKPGETEEEAVEAYQELHGFLPPSHAPRLEITTIGPDFLTKE